MRVAAIDLGTNTFHLLIVEIKDSAFQILYKTNQAIKLGEGRINENIIIPPAFERAMVCLKAFNEKIEAYKVDIVKAKATSAVRSANNGQEFIAAAKANANISIEAITGDEEATLIYEGVKLSGAIDGKSLIMDIGGGSVEFILCNEQQIFWKKSYNIGAARLMQQFFKSDPISDNEKNNILDHIQNELKELFDICAAFQPKTLIGSAGAFETFAELIEAQQHRKIDISEIRNYTFNFHDYMEMSKDIIKSTHQQRSEMKGMIALRVDMIVMATLITNGILNRLQIAHLKLSTYDLKMGIIASYL